MSISYPTQIRANPAISMQKGDIMPSVAYVQGIENRLKDIIEKRCGIVLADKTIDLEIDKLTNLEILMDLEEQVVGLHKADPNEIDAEFLKCKSFNDMMKCIKKYLLNDANDDE